MLNTIYIILICDTIFDKIINTFYHPSSDISEYIKQLGKRDRPVAAFAQNAFDYLILIVTEWSWALTLKKNHLKISYFNND